MNNLMRAFLAMLASMGASLAWSHHGWSGYDETLLTLNGAIEASSYANPHGSVRLKAQDKTWTVVLAPPSRMQARGLTRELLKPGAEAQIEGYAHRTDSSELRAERITIDGKTIELR